MKYFIDTNLILDAFERKNEESQNKLKVFKILPFKRDKSSKRKM